MYRKMIEEARKTGRASEESMWKSVENVEALLDKIKEHHPEMYYNFIRDEHEALNGPHFDCHFGNLTVAALAYTDAEGERRTGQHWSVDQVEAAWGRKAFKPGTTPWDKYVAANAMYADLCKEFSEEDVLKAAYLFYFADEDWKGEGKVWHYFRR